jgi:Uma2 family endonuclease
MMQPSAESVVQIPERAHKEFPFDRKEMQSQAHQRLFSEFTVQLMQLFADEPMVNVGGDQAFYWNSEDDRESVCPDAYVIRGIDKSPRDSFKLWEERQKFPTLSIRFVLEIWSKGNPMSERFKKYDAYRFLDVAEYLEVDLIFNELFLHRKTNNHYITIEPNDKGRIFSLELNAELALEDGLLRLYRNGEKIPTAFEAQQKIAEMESLLAKERAEKERLQKELEQLKSQQR